MVSPAVSPPSANPQLPKPATPPATPSPPSDDSSVIDDLSFDYIFDDNGGYIRLSKGSSKSHNSPPTPNDAALQPDPQSSPLSRSQSAYPGADKPAPRSFQRVTSGPALSLTPNQGLAAISKSRSLSRRVTSEEASREQDMRKLDPLNRSRPPPDNRHSVHQDEKENIGEAEEAVCHPQTKQRLSPPYSSSPTASSARHSYHHPNRMTYASSSSSVKKPSADGSQRPSHARQILPGPSRAGRMVKTASSSAIMVAPKYSGSSSGIDRIAEHDGSEGEFAPSDHHQQHPAPGDETDTGEDESPMEPAAPLSHQGVPLANVGRQRSLIVPVASSSSLVHASINRPRRSASLSDASVREDSYQLQVQQQPYPASASRPGTSLGISANADGTAGPRRVTVEEWERQEMEVRKKLKRDAEEAERHEQDILQQSARETPSPTHHNQHPQIPAIKHLGHRRRDSDTLRNVSPSLGSPTAVEPLPRVSPSSRGRISPSSRLAHVSAKHKRSPTAPEPAANGVRQKHFMSSLGKSEDGAVSSSDREHEKVKAQMAFEAHQRCQQASGQPLPSQAQLNRHIVVNKKVYARLDMIGRGGSSRVFRVLSNANELYAIKRVSLDKTDSDTMSGFINEIALLKRLEGNSRIIRLIDSEVKAGPGGSKGHLLLVMECGEIDLSRLLSEQMKDPLNMVWVAYYWQQMLQAVHVIHEEKIVHSDLKPGNFVIVKGQLKLIDFGIANAIANDTTNIQRDQQIGSANYMSPEAIELPDGMRRLKVGRPSDVWSLGCILYQMIYGQPPFHRLSMFQKMKAIPDGSYAIDFPEYSVPVSRSSRESNTPPRQLDHLKRRVKHDVIATMKSCLCRNPKERVTIPELLDQDWLAMKEPEPPSVKQLLAHDETIITPYYMRQLLEYGIALGKEGKGSSLSSEALLREAERLVAELKSTVFADAS